jgi:hypothetical protein
MTKEERDFLRDFLYQVKVFDTRLQEAYKKLGTEGKALLWDTQSSVPRLLETVEEYLNNH